MTFGLLLRKWRKEKGVSATELGGNLSRPLTDTQVRALERGVTRMPADVVQDAALHLGVPVQELFPKFTTKGDASE